MRWLIGCEQSGALRDRFIAAGHEALSVDLLPARTPGPHHQGDIFEFLKTVQPGDFDGAILHPTCTKLTVAAAWTLYHPDDKHLPTDQRRPHPRYPERRAEQDDAVAFVRNLWDTVDQLVPRIALENPVGVLSTRWRKPTQTVQPYDFGDDASKRTCLWLKGLPPLVPPPGARCPGRWVWDPVLGRMAERWANQTDRGMNRLPPSADRWKIRSDTCPGIADAMVDQWTRPDLFT